METQQPDNRVGKAADDQRGENNANCGEAQNRPAVARHGLGICRESPCEPQKPERDLEDEEAEIDLLDLAADIHDRGRKG